MAKASEVLRISRFVFTDVVLSTWKQVNNMKMRDKA